MNPATAIFSSALMQEKGSSGMEKREDLSAQSFLALLGMEVDLANPDSGKAKGDVKDDSLKEGVVTVEESEEVTTVSEPVKGKKEPVTQGILAVNSMRAEERMVLEKTENRPLPQKNSKQLSPQVKDDFPVVLKKGISTAVSKEAADSQDATPASSVKDSVIKGALDDDANGMQRVVFTHPVKDEESPSSPAKSAVTKTNSVQQEKGGVLTSLGESGEPLERVLVGAHQDKTNFVAISVPQKKTAFSVAQGGLMDVSKSMGLAESQGDTVPAVPLREISETPSESLFSGETTPEVSFKNADVTVAEQEGVERAENVESLLVSRKIDIDSSGIDPKETMSKALPVRHEDGVEIEPMVHRPVVAGESPVKADVAEEYLNLKQPADQATLGGMDKSLSISSKISTSVNTESVSVNLALASELDTESTTRVAEPVQQMLAVNVSGKVEPKMVHRRLAFSESGSSESNIEERIRSNFSSTSEQPNVAGKAGEAPLSSLAVSDELKTVEGVVQVSGNESLQPVIAPIESSERGVLENRILMHAAPEGVDGVDAPKNISSVPVVQTNAPLPAAPQTSETTVRFEELAEQFDKRLLSMVQHSEKVTRITLEPATMGRMTVTCREENATLQVEIHVQNQAVRELITRQEEHIRRAMQECNVEVGGFDVMMGQRDERQQPSPQEQALAWGARGISPASKEHEDAGDADFYYKRRAASWVA